MDKSIGGKVINSGGFGCIFLPEIICKNKNNKKHSKTRKISKMMLNRHASDEYSLIMKIKQIVKKIPNYGDYFVIKNIDICKISKLTNEDLDKYQEKCSALQKYNITKKNIRKSFDKISIVNIPYAGISLDKYIENKYTISKIIHLNKLLISLFKNAIIPMNDFGVFHSDIKSSNILINESHKKIRFIDWGLTVIHPQKYFVEIPSKWKNRPFQFNVPFEVILFTDDFVSKMNIFIETYDESNNNSRLLYIFINDYIYYWLNERGKGHLNYIHNIFIMLGIIENNSQSQSQSESESESESESQSESQSETFTNTKEKYILNFKKYKETINYITNYIVYILVNFVEFNDNASFTMMKFINDVYKKKVDIWGFLITYIPIIEILYHNKSSLDDGDKILFFSLKKIMIEYLYTPKVSMMNIKNIPKDLKKINIVLRKFSKNEFQPLDKSSHINSSIQETPPTIV
tara:strand:- start:479 stop:1861 length:1383 start_codon:yes stop_codon:yes gene_type:complete